MKNLSPLILLALILPACAHKSVSSEQNCYQMAAEGFLDKLSENWNLCKNSNAGNATSLLMTAASRNQIKVMEYLVEKGQDVNETDIAGDTPLQYAASTDQTEAVRWLLSHGANPKSFRKDGISPVMISFVRGKVETIEAFLNSPFDVNATMEDGWTVLFYAVRRGDLSILKKVLSLGANANLKSVENETPLDLAREQDWTEAIALLEKVSIPKRK